MWYTVVDIVLVFCTGTGTWYISSLRGCLAIFIGNFVVALGVEVEGLVVKVFVIVVYVKKS